MSCGEPWSYNSLECALRIDKAEVKVKPESEISPLVDVVLHHQVLTSVYSIA